ncbi:olfactory receptor 5V1-like [Bufo gargarizans]|uniref:olfactory receptor 5V1-like n=1 Tax=Bufo gargarizans TaxID=30331 RepID=UPI001CF26246|nr:olfactory receptor 5V1-like [Bufo gargarizans]
MHGNYSLMYMDFHLLAFTNYENVELLIFISLLTLYLLCVLENVLVNLIVCLTPQLHTPMYFFLCNLTVLDIIYVSAILPKLILITITGNTSISNTGCFTQVFFYVFCIGTEFFLLVCMAYDRYVAICIPLHYRLIMNHRTCLILAAFCCNLGVFNAIMYALLISHLSFSSSREINHLFCHMKSILQLARSDATSIGILITVDGVLLGFLPFILILVSYVYIISTILKIHSKSGRHKAFSSCSSHLTVVLLFCLTSLSLNMKPETEFSQEQDKLLSMLYIVVAPILNPLVYSLRNKDVLRAIKRQISRTSKMW